jgi:hypothetical protein
VLSINFITDQDFNGFVTGRGACSEELAGKQQAINLPFAARTAQLLDPRRQHIERPSGVDIINEDDSVGCFVVRPEQFS